MVKQFILLCLFLALLLQSVCRTCGEAFPGEPVAQTYQVHPGDTLVMIARMHDLSVKELIEMNPNLGSDPIQIGD